MHAGIFKLPNFSIAKLQNCFLLVSVQQVAGFQGEFACDFDYGDAAVDGVDIHDANGSGERRDFVNEIIVGSGDDDGGMVGASVIGGGDELAHLALRHAKDFFDDHLHFRRGGRAHDEGDRLAIRPAIALRFADLDQVGESDGADGVGFVGDQGEIARRRQ